MVETGRNELKLCPYWRRVAIQGDYAIALCGATSVNEKPLEGNDIGKRLDYCPWEYGVDYAYDDPSFIELRRSDGRWRIWGIVDATVLKGEAGIRSLERK